MQTFITEFNFEESAERLDYRRRGSQIYEGIQIAASLLGVCDKLVNPKRDVSNHPAAKLWVGYIPELIDYIYYHWEASGQRYGINYQNLEMLCRESGYWPGDSAGVMPEFICPDLVRTHRSVLIQKKPEYYSPIWPCVPDNLEMKYNWR